jgi:cytidylate kinase
MRASAHETEGPESRPPPFTIALSREVGARGTSTARELGGRLNWPVYDHEIMEKIAREMKLHPRQLAGVDEKHTGLLAEFAESFSTGPYVSEIGYVRRLTKTLQALAEQGECVVVGRGAPHIMPEATTLRVRLVAALDDRVAAIAAERGISMREAARHVEKKDHERTQFVKHNFHQDPANPQLYDLIVNTSRFSIPETAEVIIEALRRLQARRRH